jgi:hypothetical protein
MKKNGKKNSGVISAAYLYTRTKKRNMKTFAAIVLKKIRSIWTAAVGHAAQAVARMITAVRRDGTGCTADRQTVPRRRPFLKYASYTARSGILCCPRT